MKKVFSLSSIIVIIIVFLVVKFKPSFLHIFFEFEFPPPIPLSISMDSSGNIDFEVKTGLPTYLGNFSIGVKSDPIQYFHVKNVLTIRVNGKEYYYDLHGKNFKIQFEEGYYKSISIQKDGNNNILIELVKVIPEQDPKQFIYDYYNSINNRQYDLTWSKLSGDYISRNNGQSNGGYEGYVEFWNSVSYISVVETNLVNYEDKSAKVVATLHYEYKNGNAHNDKVYFQIIYSSNKKTWLIDATPTNWNVQ